MDGKMCECNFCLVILGKFGFLKLCKDCSARIATLLIVFYEILVKYWDIYTRMNLKIIMAWQIFVGFNKDLSSLPLNCCPKSCNFFSFKISLEMLSGLTPFAFHLLKIKKQILVIPLYKLKSLPDFPSVSLLPLGFNEEDSVTPLQPKICLQGKLKQRPTIATYTKVTYDKPL